MFPEPPTQVISKANIGQFRFMQTGKHVNIDHTNDLFGDFVKKFPQKSKNRLVSCSFLSKLQTVG